MKKIILISILCTLAVVLTACGASASTPQSNSVSGSVDVNANSSSSSNATQISGIPATGPSALQLAAGMIKLDGTSNAVTAQEATQLLPLWQSLQQTESTPAAGQGAPQGTGTPGPRPNFAMMQQVGTQLMTIETAKPPAQIQAITAMNLSRQDIATIFQQDGIVMSAQGSGGSGFRQNGGTFTPPQGNPPVAGTPGAFQGNGARPRFGGFIPQSVVDGIVQYLQKKAGS